MRVISVPCRAPRAAVTASAAGIAAHHGQPMEGRTRIVTTVAPIPAMNPSDRSISPRRRTNTSPMPISMNTEPCTSRLTRLPADRNFAFCVWKMIPIRITPSTTGSTPLWPASTRCHSIRP